ncbi:hypothetical protein GE569_31665 [Burkholderia gladioli]
MPRFSSRRRSCFRRCAVFRARPAVDNRRPKRGNRAACEFRREPLVTPRILLSSLLALLVACSFGAPAAGAADTTALELVAQSTAMPWNAVALDARGRIFVSSPKWTGGTGPALATIEADGRLAPYPDAAWNGWTPGADAARAFVSINAIHREADGSLWIVDTGSPEFGGTPVPNGAKLVQVDPREDRVLRVYPFPASAIRAHTYVDDVRIHGRHAYLTDAGEGAILVLDLDSGAVRRRFDGMAFAQAAPDARIVVAGRVLRGPDGRPLRVNADPLELSPDGKTFYFGPLSGPMSRIETRYLDDDHLSDAELARHVRRWFALPPVGGTAMDAAGNLYYTPLADNTLMRRAPDGRVTRLARDARLRWVDAPFLDGQGHLYLPVPQIDGAPVFNHGHSTMRLPIALYRVRLPAD